MFDKFFGEASGNKLFRWGAAVLMMLTIFLGVKVVAEFTRLPNISKEVYPQSTITVNGIGEAYAIPDIASFNFSVTELGDTVQQAQEKLDQKINKALSGVREAGIADKDIKTLSYNVYPKYEWEQKYCPQIVGTTCNPGKNVLKGYEVSQSVLVKVRDTAKVGDLVTKVGAVGITNISGVEFTVDDREKFVAEARDQAIADAKAKAKVLAKELGVHLGKMLYYNDNGSMMPYADGRGGSMMSESAVAPMMKAELPVGENKITANISITYELK